jgi:phosphonate transport system ATP-binding protein
VRHETIVAESRAPRGSPANPAGAMSILEVRNLKVRYGANGPQVLKGIDFEVGGNDFCAVIGPSGAGKSTLIRCINRLVEPTEGDITLFGQNVRALHGSELRRLRRRIGMIFQEFNLVDRMSVMDNVLSGRLGYTGAFRSFFKAFPREDIDRALHLLEEVGLQDHVDKRADALSGGQRQRVGIARALMQQPEILLLDEPTSALDPKISRDVMALIRDLAAEYKVPVLCNIHDVQLALETCNRIIGMQDGYKKFDGSSKSMRKQDLDEIYAMEVL